MKSRFAVNNPRSTEFLMEIIMPLSDWEKIAKMLQEHGGVSSPYLEFRRRIQAMVHHATESWTGEQEDLE